MQLCFYLGIVLLIIIVLGVAGNTISMLVWTKGRHCKRTPCAVFLRALAVSDTFALCIPALNEAVGLIVGVYPNHQNIVICKIEVFGRHFGLLVSSWLIVFFSVERTLTVLQPLRQRWWDKRQNSVILIGGIFAVVFLLNVPYALVYDIKPIDYTQNVTLIRTSDTDTVMRENSSAHVQNLSNSSQFPCVETRHKTRNCKLLLLNHTFGVALNAKHDRLPVTDDNAETQLAIESKTNNTRNGLECGSDPNSFFNFYNWYHIWLMDFVLIFVVPFTLITTCNLIVIYFIVFYRKRMNLATGTPCALAVTKRAIAVSVMHCITTGPFSVFVLIPGLAERAFGVKYSTEFYVLTVVLIFAYLNHGINYILYSVFGSDFRRDCVELFRLRPTRVSWEMTFSTAVSKPQALARNHVNCSKEKY